MLRLIFVFSCYLVLSTLWIACRKTESPPAPTTPDPVIRGADLSFVPEAERYGAKYRDAQGNPKDILQLFAEAGGNTVRLRLWHSPTGVGSSWGEVMAFAARVRRAKLRLWLDLHYSDTWADPGNQAPPARWQNLSLAALSDSIYAYTAQAVSRLQPDYVQVGNEINGGILWEQGRINNFTNFTALLRRGCEAVRATRPQTQIIMHYAGVYGAVEFFTLLQQQANVVDYDIAAISYYPLWHGKDLNALENTLRQINVQLRKPSLIAETSYPFTLDWQDYTHNVVGLTEQLISGYDATPQGQRDFLQRIRQISTTNIPMGMGFCYWGGEWIAYKGSTAIDGSSFENQALFDFQHKALPAWEVFRP